jgi:Co/Zn/Cd efflux system component
MSAACNHGPIEFDGQSPGFRRALWVVIFINAAMFVVEIIAGSIAGSQALQADALDFLADSVTYGISLAVIGQSLLVRSSAALAKGISLFLMGTWVLGSTLWQVFGVGVPHAGIMGSVGMAALAANLLSVVILMRWRDGDSNVRSVWLCSRNDAIGNCAVMLAALGVFGTGTAWPDLVVAGIMAGLFVWSAQAIVRQALAERRLVAAGQAIPVARTCGHAHAKGSDHHHAH